MDGSNSITHRDQKESVDIRAELLIKLMKIKNKKEPKLVLMNIQSPLKY